MFDLKEYTENTKKWILSTISAVIFMIVASPYLYALTDKFIAVPLGFKYVEPGMQPTILGQAIHTLVFLLIVRIMMM